MLSSANIIRTTSSNRMINDWEEHGGKRPWPNLRLYPGTCLEKLRKLRQTLEYVVSGSRF